jgi:signal transduction histidine kinase
LLPAVLATVTAATRAPAAAVLDADGRLLAGELMEPSECMPLRVGGEPVGTLRLTWRSPTTPYAGADRKLLEALIPQVVVVVCTLDLAEALESERDRVVAVTRSERDRFRRDLHDGLGPSLSGIGLGLQVASDALEARDVAAADRMVAAGREEIARLVEEVRRIIDDLRPAALDQFGLVEALRRHADSLAPRVPVEVRVTALPAIRPAVEIAAYRIVREALTNIVRHAEATGATVDLAADGSDLLISITDDGRGHAAERTEGVGMPSMRRRAEALGGTLDTSGGQGTTVTARLPLEAIP